MKKKLILLMILSIAILSYSATLYNNQSDQVVQTLIGGHSPLVATESGEFYFYNFPKEVQANYTLVSEETGSTTIRFQLQNANLHGMALGFSLYAFNKKNSNPTLIFSGKLDKSNNFQEEKNVSWSDIAVKRYIKNADTSLGFVFYLEGKTPNIKKNIEGNLVVTF